MAEFAEEGKCPECGGELRVKSWRGSDRVCCGKCRRVYKPCIDHIFTGLYYTGEILDLNDDSQKLSPADFYDTQIQRRQFYLAAQPEPSATVEWASRLYHGVFMWELTEGKTRNLWLDYIRKLLATAPVEVRETPQSGEEVKDD